MALKDKMNTAKTVLADSKSRMVVVILAIIVIIVFVVAYIKFKRSETPQLVLPLLLLEPQVLFLFPEWESQPGNTLNYRNNKI